MIAAPASGAGKTTVTMGLLRALRQDGVAVQPFKNGPDYIDPAFHRAACGRTSFNLDSWAMPLPLIAGLRAQAQGADLIVAEGSMGLFDGVAPGPAAPGAPHGIGASADIARAAGWPVILVIDASGQAQSAAATALGFARFDPGLKVGGVILNRVASPRHEKLIRQGMAQVGLPVLGALPRRSDLALPERHLGLIQAIEHPDLERLLDQCADFVRAHVDLAALRALAQGAPAAEAGSIACPPPAQTIAVAQDEAFSFLYPHVLDGWRRAGAQVLPFSPLADEAPPPQADLVWLPGGYPELHAGRLAAANTFLDGLRRHAASRPVHGECGGYMVLGEALIDKAGESHGMAGLLGLATSHAQRKLNLGYRRARLLGPVGALAAGTALRGHEFHYSTIVRHTDEPLARVSDAAGDPVPQGGSRRGQVTGSFFHLIACAP